MKGRKCRGYLKRFINFEDFEMSKETELNCAKLFKNGPSKICGRQSLVDHDTSNFLKAVFHKCYLAHS